MKKTTLLVLLLFLVNYCSAQNKELLKLYEPQKACKTTITTTIYHIESGFCATSIYLNSDSTFLKEEGCEGNSHITMGKWKPMGDSIELKAISQKKLSPICNIQISKQKSVTNNVTFIVKDKTGKPVRDFTILPLKKSQKYTFTSSAKVVRYSNKKNVELFETNDSGKVVVDCANYDSLEFSKLKLLTGKKHRFSAKNLPDSVTITLTINATAIMYPELSYQYIKKPVNYKREDKKLKRGELELMLEEKEKQ